MATPESIAWTKLIDAIAFHEGDVADLVMSPDSSNLLASVKDSIGRELPKPLRSLYSTTNGFEMSGYLPDRYGTATCTFSLIPVSDLAAWHANMLENDGSRGGAWRHLPHWLKTLTMADDADGIWNTNWIPFATDGAASVQFISTGVRRGIFQYSPESFGIRRCGRSLPGYLTKVAHDIRSSKLKVFDLKSING